MYCVGECSQRPGEGTLVSILQMHTTKEAQSSEVLCPRSHGGAGAGGGG